MIHKPGSGVHPALWPVGGEPPVDLTGSALLLEGDAQSGTDRILLEGDAQAGTDVLLLEGTL